MEVLKDDAMNGTTRRYVIGLTCNQRSVRIEELVTRRKHMHIQMLENQLYELKDVPPSLLALVTDSLEKARAENAAMFNDNSFNKKAMGDGLDLCTLIKLISPGLQDLVRFASLRPPCSTERVLTDPATPLPNIQRSSRVWTLSGTGTLRGRSHDGGNQRGAGGAAPGEARRAMRGHARGPSPPLPRSVYYIALYIPHTHTGELPRHFMRGSKLYPIF